MGIILAELFRCAPVYEGTILEPFKGWIFAIATLEGLGLWVGGPVIVILFLILLVSSFLSIIIITTVIS